MGERPQQLPPKQESHGEAAERRGRTKEKGQGIRKGGERVHMQTRVGGGGGSSPPQRGSKGNQQRAQSTGIGYA